MAKRFPAPCTHPLCVELTLETYCREHRRQEWRRYTKERGTSEQRGYNTLWKKARKRFLYENPICVECKKRGRIIPAETVDHVVPHKGDYVLFWDQRNWQALCRSCHSVKTATYDGGFGNPVRPYVQ